MTFEDFFIKKRIDLRQLEKVEPQLYREFKSHFELMGEKSFDHTKKFWFNRLRKSYHLKEEVGLSQAPISTSSLDENKAIAAAESPQAAKPTGFKPRFKATPPTGEAKPAPNPETDTDSASKAPTGFKPRFKPGQTTRSKEDHAEDQPVKGEDTPPTVAPATDHVNKPSGFKPRFKAGVTNKETATPKEEPALPKQLETTGKTEEPSETQKTGEPKDLSKPMGFKPRFKAGLTDKTAVEHLRKEPDHPSNQASKVEGESKDAKDVSDKSAANEPPTISKPTGFKPRFKAGITNKTSTEKPQQTSNPRAEEDKKNMAPEAKAEVPHTNPNTDTEHNAASTEAKPLGFKPRFKPGLKKGDTGNDK
ncbi:MULTISPECIES: hypothetical protein [Olivibacter]|uniref:Uncharacterized protein n=1 Tax=Olivibacter jilunii TaxID=985016 RepID=A0ABW6AXC0_9SPHI|nr:hypothetical protein [Olivibacter sp. UJ_SKK_5.1]MDX3911942.1 hypothetical protein [Pseudosphingobacterium sp.]